MNRTTVGIQFVCALASCVLSAGPAVAQSERPTGGPFSGLFKGSPKDQPQILDVRASAFAAWDDNLLAQAPGGVGSEGLNVVDPRYIKQGIANGFQAGALYGFRRNGTRSQFNMSADAAVQQFAGGLDNGPLWFHSYGASAGLATKVTNKTSLSLGAGAGYAPYYQYAPFLQSTASEESPVGNDYGFAVQSEWVRSTQASASVLNQFSKRSGVSVGVEWTQRIIPGNDAAAFDGRTARITFSHRFTRKLAFQLGYGIQETRNLSSPDIEPVRANMLDIGLGYGDGITLSLGRHTVLGLSIGASVAKNGDPALLARSGKDTALVVNGSATLSRSIGRSWGTSLAYVRGTSYVVGFPQPLITDGANAGIGGPLTSRLQFSAGAGASRGQQLFTGGGTIVSYSASTRVTFAVFSYLGLFSQASYYRFSIPEGFGNLGFVPDLDRRSVSVGLTTWLPLIKHGRERRPDDNQPTGQP